MIFYKPRLLRWNNNAITDHNRSELGVDYEEFGTDHRTANGTARSYVITKKKQFSVSWTDIPHSATNTVDNFWGAKEMEQFFLSNKYFDCEITNGDFSTEVYKCRFTGFNKSLKKRGKYDLYDLSANFEEA